MLSLLRHFRTGVQLKLFAGRIERAKPFWREQVRRSIDNNIRIRIAVMLTLQINFLLCSFQQVLSELSPEDSKRLLELNKAGLLEIGKRQRSNTRRAYFAYMLSQTACIGNAIPYDYSELMLDYLKDRSIFVRENALKALYHFGHPEDLSRALIVLSITGKNHSVKLLADGMMSFTGDMAQLADVLMRDFDRYSDCYRTAVVNYLIHLDDHRFDRVLIRKLKLEEFSANTVCSILRLFGKDTTARNERVLIKYAKNFDDERKWEAAAVAVLSLGNFAPNEIVISVLEEALTSRNWYVRMNSAKSLCQLGLSQDELDKILSTEDRYAKDAINYAISKVS